MTDLELTASPSSAVPNAAPREAATTLVDLPEAVLSNVVAHLRLRDAVRLSQACQTLYATIPARVQREHSPLGAVLPPGSSPSMALLDRLAPPPRTVVLDRLAMGNEPASLQRLLRWSQLGAVLEMSAARELRRLCPEPPPESTSASESAPEPLPQDQPQARAMASGGLHLLLVTAEDLFATAIEPFCLPLFDDAVIYINDEPSFHPLHPWGDGVIRGAAGEDCVRIVCEGLSQLAARARLLRVLVCRRPPPLDAALSSRPLQRLQVLHTILPRAPAPALSSTALAALAGLRCVSLTNGIGLREVNALGRVEVLSLSFFDDLEDVGGLGGVRELMIRGPCPRLVSVAALASVQTLVLMRLPNVRDLQALCSVPQLHLQECGHEAARQAEPYPDHADNNANPHPNAGPALPTLAVTMQVQQLRLSMSPVLAADAGVLEALEELSLARMPLERLPRLGPAVQRVTLADLPQLRSLAGLEQVPVLLVSRCKGLQDVAVLGAPHSRVRQLRLSGLSADFCDVRPLARIDVVTLMECAGLEDVSALGPGQTQLALFSLPRLVEVVSLGAVRERLSICSCPRVRDVSALGRVPHLSLVNCDAVSDVSSLHGVDTLDLSGCDHVSEIGALRNVKTLRLCNLPMLTTEALHGLAGGQTRTLDISGCHLVTDISMLGHLQTIRARHTGMNRSDVLRDWRSPDGPLHRVHHIAV